MAELSYNATVHERIDLAHGLMILRVVPDDGVFSFLPGQYTVLGLKPSEDVAPFVNVPHDKATSNKMILRAYSIASGNHVTDYLEFYLTLVSSGELTPRLFNLKKNDRIYISRKATGLFTLDRVPPPCHVLLVATGTGLAPYISMLQSQLVCGGERKFAVLQGARLSWDLGYRSQLEGLAASCPNFSYFPAISRPSEDPSWQGLSGYLQDILMSGVIQKKSGIELNPEKTHVFLCGNPGMIEAAKERLFNLGYTGDKGRESGTLHTEEYW